MRSTKRIGIAALIALAGAAVAVIPAVASSDTSPTVNGLDTVVWSPAQVSVDVGGSVNFVNSSGVLHGVVWNGGPATPTCSGIPLGDNFGSSWSGSCAFAQAGTYSYYCSYHGSSMAGKVIVSAPGSPTTPTTSTPTGTTTTGSTPGGGTPLPLALGAVSVAKTQHGTSVRGSAKLGQAGSRLEVDLGAPTAALAASYGSTKSNAGRLIKRAVGSGKVSFSARLNAKARQALRRRGRLALKVTITVAPPGGAARHATRHVTLRG
ncbi:MAG TPA: plastocyanin/azurin family copper-binding protein [Solirubrobacteraceae bacterium]|nr:plastocyanin/azurin family copper-binding protein [Solirubrobacteraceae bacterium]